MRERQRLQVPGWAESATQRLLACSDTDTCSYQRGWSVGQNIYTPRDITVSEFIDGDRVYAGWLYGGMHAAVRNRRQMHRVAIDLGILGPSAGGEFVQSEWHALWCLDTPMGWDHQMKDEPGVVLTHEYKRKLVVTGFDLDPLDCPRLCSDLIASSTITAGTIFNLAEAGARFRFGSDVDDDFGVGVITPVIFNMVTSERPDQKWFRWYVFAGVAARGVLRNSLIEGSLFHEGPSLKPERFVHDLELGAAVSFKRRYRVIFQYIVRSPEISGESESHRYGSMAFSILPSSLY